MKILDFLSDYPTPLAKDNDPFGCLDTAATLYEILAGWHDQKKSPLIIGVLGGFGQGKSTILETLREPLRNKKWNGVSKLVLSRPIEIIAVESWHYQPDEIEGHFNQVMTRETLLKRAGLVQKAIFAAFSDFVPGLKVTLGGGVRHSVVERSFLGVKKVKLASEGWNKFRNNPKESMVKLWQFLLKERPKKLLKEQHNFLLWFDDLDRCSAQVQLAFLKQLYAHRENFDVPIVVAINPSEILAGNDRSNNEDLLRKVFTATLVLPVKRTEHFLVYARKLCLQKFPSLDPVIIQSIANLISYFTSGNPRFVKRYLNSLAITVHSIEREQKNNELSGEEFQCLARWMLAQTRWPLLLGYHGEEELVFSLLRRLVIGEPVKASLKDFIATMDTGNELNKQYEEVVHFLQQTSGLVGSSEIKVLGWLTGKGTQPGQFDWLSFWDMVECHRPNEAIDYLKSFENLESLFEDSDHQDKFLEHCNARLSRWINRRCFSEAVAILDLLWRIVYEQEGWISQLEGLQEGKKEVFFRFLLEAIAHERVAAAWCTRFTYPNLNSLTRVRERLPKNWASLYLKTISNLDGDALDIIGFFHELIKNGWEPLEGETKHKAINLLIKLLLDNWQRCQGTSALDDLGELLKEINNQPLLFDLANGLQKHLENMGGTSPTSAEVRVFEDISYSYAWALRLLSEGVVGTRLGHSFFTSWFLHWEQILSYRKKESKNEPLISQQPLLETARELIDISLRPFLGLLSRQDIELKHFQKNFIDRIDWQSLLISIDKEIPADNSLVKKEELTECVSLLLEIMAFLKTLPSINSQITSNLGLKLAEGIIKFKNHESIHVLLALAAFMGLVATRQEAAGVDDDRFFFDIASRDAFFKSLFACFPPAKPPATMPKIMSIIWYHIVRGLLSWQPPEELLLEACRFLNTTEIFAIYLNNNSQLQGLEAYWAKLMMDDEKWKEEFIHNLRTNPTIQTIPVAKEFGALLSRVEDDDVFQTVTPTLQGVFAKRGGLSAVIAFRCGILAGDIAKWRLLTIIEEERYSVLTIVEKYLRARDEQHHVQMLKQQFLAAGDATTRLALYDVLPMFQAYASALAKTPNGQKEHEDFFNNMHVIIKEIESETNDQDIRQLMEALKDQL